mgnify:CR=1 FL=1
MSSFKKMISILDLFSKDRTVWTTDEINDALDLTKPTTYRYIRELTEVGLLARMTGGSYILGPKIIELDYKIRWSDPLIAVSVPVMKEIQQLSGCDVLLSGMYNDKVLIIHDEQRLDDFKLRRGVLLPLFRGAMSKIILAYLQRNQLQNIYEKYTEEIAGNGLGESWEKFRLYLSGLRKQGYSISHEELVPNMTAISAPIFQYGQVRCSISVGLPTNRFHLFKEERLVELVVGTAERITRLVKGHPAATEHANFAGD